MRVGKCAFGHKEVGAGSADWVKDIRHPHDFALPGSIGAKITFLMYLQAEPSGKRVDSLDPDTFRYRISTRVVTA